MEVILLAYVDVVVIMGDTNQDTTKSRSILMR